MGPDWWGRFTSALSILSWSLRVFRPSQRPPVCHPQASPLRGEPAPSSSDKAAAESGGAESGCQNCPLCTGMNYCNCPLCGNRLSNIAGKKSLNCPCSPIAPPCFNWLRLGQTHNSLKDRPGSCPSCAPSRAKFAQPDGLYTQLMYMVV